MTDLAALLADPAAVPVEDIPAAIGELERVKAVLWARLANPAPAAVPTVTPMSLDTPGAARLLGISATALRRLVAAGEVPVVRFGRRVLYRRETLERLRVERERNGAR